MSSARDAILGRIQTALRDLPAQAEATPPARGYRRTDDGSHAEIVASFIERVAEYKASVRAISERDLPAEIAATLQTRGVQRLVVPGDLPEAWLPAGIVALRDEGDLTNTMLDESDGVLTGCALGIAQTGTIILDHGPGQGRRALTLIPDYHLCVVRAEQIVGLVPEAITALQGAAHARRPITFISGPSATSDIELNRVEGVHGPRTLEVLVVVADESPLSA